MAGRPIRAALLAAAALAAGAAAAERPFLMPSSSNVPGLLGTVTIDAAVADSLFQFDHRPIPLAQLKVYRPDGSEAPAPDGTTGRFRSSFDLRIDAPGTWKVASVSTMVNGTAKVGGDERRVTSFRRPGPPPAGPAGPGGPGGPGGERRQPPILLAELPADATDLHLTETVARTEAFVTSGVPTTAVFGGDPRGLTLQPISHPTDLVADQPARFRFLLDGRPAAGIKAVLIPQGQRFRDGEAGIPLTADAAGTVSIRWPAPGYYLLAATAEDGHPAEPRATARRLAYAATLEVAAP